MIAFSGGPRNRRDEERPIQAAQPDRPGVDRERVTAAVLSFSEQGRCPLGDLAEQPGQACDLDPIAAVGGPGDDPVEKGELAVALVHRDRDVPDTRQRIGQPGQLDRAVLLARREADRPVRDREVR